MAAIVHHDYTVGANTNIDAYTEDGITYIYGVGSGNAMFVSAANDRVEFTEPTGDVEARMSGPGIPTANQEILGTIYAESGSGATINVRCATSGNLGNWYSVFVDTTVVNESQLYRFDNGAFNLIDDELSSNVIEE